MFSASLFPEVDYLWRSAGRAPSRAIYFTVSRLRGLVEEDSNESIGFLKAFLFAKLIMASSGYQRHFGASFCCSSKRARGKKQKFSKTPLHLACANGHVDVVTFLVENKCKLNLFDNDNRSPLMKAVQCQQEECVAVLLEHGADPNLADADGNTALHLAVISPNTYVARLLLEHNASIDAQNKEGYTPLILAISKHQEEIVEFLLKKGADVHARDQCERTPLMTAASGGDLNVIKVLLRYGADVSHKDTNGWTAEEYAVLHGYPSLSKQLAEYADWVNTGEASAGILSTPHRAGAAGFMLGAPAVDRGGMQQSPNQTSRTGKSRKVIDDSSQGDSIRSSEKAGSDDSWHTSEEEELDFTPKKLQKPNLTLLMNASRQFKKNNDCDGSRIECPKSPMKSLKQRAPLGADLNKREHGELNQDVSDASNPEEEELEEEEDDDENDNEGEKEEYEEEEEEEDEDLTQDEKEEENLEDEGTESHDILEEEQEEKTESEGEINQKLEYFSNAKHKGEDCCGTGDVYDDDKISKELDEKVEEPVDTPVSFIAGCYERLQENVTAMSPKIMNNEVSCKSIPKQAVFQNLNNLQDTQESWSRKSMIQEKFHRNAASCFAGSETTGWKREIPQPFSDACDLKEKKSGLGDSFENCNNPWSAAKNPTLESQRPNSVILVHVDDEDSEEQHEVDDKVCEALKQESEILQLNRCEENLKEAFHSSTEEESPEWEKDEEEQQKEDSGEELQTAVVEGVRNSVCNDGHQVHDASKDSAGERDALPTVGAEEDDAAESPWDSEADSESPRKVSSGVLLPAADRHGTCSQRVSGCQGSRDRDFSEKPSNSQLKTPKSVLEMNETSPEKRQQKSDLLEEFGLGDAEDIEGESSASSFHMSSSAEKDINDASDNYEDKYILETTNLIEKTAHENQTDKAEISHQEALAKNEESHIGDKQLRPKHWEERYERMWVENEKRELKTNFKNVTAELKQLFGEINETGKTTSLVQEMSGDGFSEELKSSRVVSSHATEPSNKLESKGESGDTKLRLGGKVPKMEIVIPSFGVLPDQNNLNANVEDTCSTDEEDNTNDTDNTKMLLAKGEKKKPTLEMEENENGSSRNIEGSPESFLRRSLKTSILDDISNILPEARPVSTGDENALFVTERKLKKDSGFNYDLPRDCLVNNNKIGETEIEGLFANPQESCGVLKGNLDEDLKQDMERFKSKVGMLQMVEKERNKQKCFKTHVVAKQEDLDKLSTPQENVTNQQMKLKLTPKKNDSLKMEDENAVEEKDKNFSSEHRSKSVKTSMKGKFALNAKVAKKKKRQTSKQNANQQISSSSGNHVQVLDDSNFSESSQDEERPPAKTRSEKNKVSQQMDVTDDLDLTQSSDTTSEDVELPTSNYKEAILLLEQLSVDHIGSAILSKIQNILLEYEQIIKREKNRYTAVWRKVRKLESEKEESQIIAKETQDLKSILAHQEMEWKSDIQSLKYNLKQEEEKRLRVETLYEKTREKLRSKDDQYCKEMEEKRQLELRSTNLEMELVTLKKHLKQVEEERDETQRQLSQEKSARALQEGILNNHLWRQKELEEETRRTIEKNSE
ncbi:PREDICTED: ankyrin repeat domain-containing protein 18A-like, partial [Buceros rhinoceros silvestris]|uniref:ankyrin repeat domain-containing protein 18A-like n=1 Tax=Buceros rhinoceros silvestris TaxID=175836 RepID=UPI0005281321